MGFSYKPYTSGMCMVHFKKDEQQCYSHRQMFQQSHCEVSFYGNLSM